MGLVAALLVAAACGGDGGEDEGSEKKSTKGASSSTAASTTTTVPPPLDAASLTWKLKPGGLPDASNLNGITAWKDGFVAIGVDVTTDSTAVWSSDDGMEWTKVEADPEVFIAKEYPADIAIDGAQLLMVGFLNDGAQGRPRAWTSTNGTDWERVEDSSFPATRTGVFTQVNAGEGGFTALLSAEDAKLVTSGDAVTWEVHDSPIAEPGTSSMVNEVVEGGRGYVAVGSTGQRPGDAAVWMSSDGDTWEQATSADLGGDRFQSASAVVATPSGLVAGGSANTGASEDAALWTSTDGTAWKLVSTDTAVFGGPTGGGVDEVIDVDGTLLAVGRGGAGAQPTVGIWTSPDGTTWSAAPSSVEPAGGLIPRVTGVAVTSKAAVALARLTRFNPATGKFVISDLAVYVGSPA